MTLDIKKLTYFTAGRDPQGRPTLTPKPLPPEYASASPVSRRSYYFEAQKEHEAVRAAAREANAPERPDGFDRASPVSQRAWQLAAQKGDQS